MCKCSTLVLLSALPLLACGTSGYEMNEPSTGAQSMDRPAEALGLGGASTTPEFPIRAGIAADTDAQPALAEGSGAATLRGEEAIPPTLLLADSTGCGGYQGVDGLGTTEDGVVGSATYVLTDISQDMVVYGCGCTRCDANDSCVAGEECFVSTAGASEDAAGLWPCDISSFGGESVSADGLAEEPPETLSIEAQPRTSIDSEPETDDTSDAPSLI